jgi:hypothetical protein
LITVASAKVIHFHEASVKVNRVLTINYTSAKVIFIHFSFNESELRLKNIWI